MAARVEAMEQALAAREAQLAGDRAASHHSASSGKRTAALGRHVDYGQQRPAAARQAQAAAGVSRPMEGLDSAADTLRAPPSMASRSSAQQCAWADPPSAPSSPGAGARKQRSVAQRPVLGRYSSEPPRIDVARASDGGSPRSMAGRWRAEAQCCGGRACSHEAVADAPTQLFYQQPSPARASREATAASQPDARASARSQRSSLSSGDGGYNGASAHRKQHGTSAGAPAATLRPAARLDEEPQPRALLPAPLRPRAASASSCPRRQSDATAHMQTRDRRQHEPDDAVQNNRGLPHGRLRSHSHSRGGSDRGARQAPAAPAADRVSRQGSVGDASNASAGRAGPVSSPEDGGRHLPSSLMNGTAGEAAAVFAENAALREALRSGEQALAAARKEAQHSVARSEEVTAQLADVQRAAQADAERANARIHQLTEELARYASALQRLA